MADFTLGAAASKPLQKFVSAFVPYGLKNAEGTAVRKVGFSKVDTNGTGMASLAEVENFIASALQVTLEDDVYAGDLFDLFRPCFGTAFNRAKELSKNNGKVLKGAKTATADDYISFPEFRMFCVYLQIFAALYDVFTSVDGGEGRTEDDDSRINLEEFLGGYHSLGGLGFQALQGLDTDEKATNLFKAVDANDGGFVLYREWSTYISAQEIKSKTHVGSLLNGNLKPTKIAGRKSGSSSRASSVSTRRSQKSKVSPSKKGYSPKSKMPVVAGVYKPGKTCSNELKDFIKIIQPYAEKNSDSLKLRKTGYRKCDSNGTGECSLAEVDGFVLTALKKSYGQKLGRKIFKQFRPSYIVAYNGAKNLKANATGNDDDYINFQEFRILNVYLAVYAGMLDAFSTIDGGGEGVSEEDDRRLGQKEWLSGFMNLTNTGFVGLDNLSGEDDALTMFEQMDPDQSGRAVFQDFCDYLSEAEIEANTDLGMLLAGSSLKSRKIEEETFSAPITEAPQDANPEPEHIVEETEAPSDESEPEPQALDEPAEEPVEAEVDEPEPEPEALDEPAEEPVEAEVDEPEPETEDLEEPAEEPEPEPEPEPEDLEEPVEEPEPEHEALDEPAEEAVDEKSVTEEVKDPTEQLAELGLGHEPAEQEANPQ